MRAWLSAGVFVVACVPRSESPIEGRMGIERSEVAETSQQALLFERASERWDVPADLLKALAFTETRFEAAVGVIEFDDQPAPYGLLALRGEELTRAVALSGLSLEAVQTEDEANIFAGAALLDAYAQEVGLDEAQRSDPLAWGQVLSRYGKLDEEMGEHFAGDVLRVLKSGVAVPQIDGSTILIARYGESDGAEAEFGQSSLGLGQPGVVSRPSPNNSSRGGTPVEMIVIHSCEGGYAGCVSTLRNGSGSRRVSAHYVVKEDGREISQLVDENRKAWHIGARYRSRLNSGRLSHRDNVSSNNFSVGIEHGGRAAQRTWPEAQIAASVELVRGITSRHNVPRDRYHIVSHGQLQPESRTDPGPNWPWTSYLQRISAGGGGTPPPTSCTHSFGGTYGDGACSGSFQCCAGNWRSGQNVCGACTCVEGTGQTGCDGGTPPPTIITVDNADPTRFRASSNWEVSGWASGKVGADYRFRAPAPTSDPAEYRVAIPERGQYEVFARVPGNGYNTNVPYVIRHRGGQTTVNANIRESGASWLSLGTFEFDQGDDWNVLISCWTNGEGFLIADAIRLERR